MSDPSIAYIAGLHAKDSANETSILQGTIMFYLLHKGGATTTAILVFVNRIDPDNGKYRSQSAVSHSISELESRGFITRDPSTHQYTNTEKARRYLRFFFRKSYNIEKQITSFVEESSILQPLHVENKTPSC